jgi:hypothetical protein
MREKMAAAATVDAVEVAAYGMAGRAEEMRRRRRRRWRRRWPSPVGAGGGAEVTKVGQHR